MMNEPFPLVCLGPLPQPLREAAEERRLARCYLELRRSVLGSAGSRYLAGAFLAARRHERRARRLEAGKEILRADQNAA